MDSDMLSKQATQRKNAYSGLSLIEVMLMLTLLAATVLPCSLLLSQTGQNARAAYLQSTRSILLNSIQDEQSPDRVNYVGNYNLGAMNTSTTESGQVIPWRSVVDTTNAGASDTFQKTVYYYLYNSASDAANAPRYTTKIIHSRDTLRIYFNSTLNAYVDASGYWWSAYSIYNASNVIPGINISGSPATTVNNYAGQTISNLPSHRDAAIYQGGLWRDGAPITYTAPVSNGLYTVKLHFAENATGTARLMDINIEGKLMNPGNPYNIVLYCGNQSWCANVQLFDVVVTDGNLDITISPNSNTVNDDPYIQAISIKKRI